MSAPIYIYQSEERIRGPANGESNNCDGRRQRHRAHLRGIAGLRIVIADIDEPARQELASSLVADGAQVAAITTDVSELADVEKTTRDTAEWFGRIDVLINNADFFRRPTVIARVPFEQIPLDEWDHMMSVNLRGAFLCCRSVVPYMKFQRAGKMVSITSSTVYYEGNFVARYVTSKAGVIGLTRSLARELGSHGINVNAIAPGLTLSLEDPPEMVLQTNAQRVQLRSTQRDQLPDNLVGSMIFLSSSDSDFMTGQTMVVGGGARIF